MSTTTTTASRLANAPRVNLLPPEIQQRKQAQRVQGGLVILVALAVLGTGYAYVHGGSAVTSAKENLADAQTQQTKLTAQLARLQYVDATAAQLAAAEATVTQAMASEIHFSDFMADLSLITPPRTWFTDVNFSESVGVGSLSSPDQAPAAVGSVGFSGVALSHPDLATWLDAAAKEKGFVDPYFSTSAEQMIGTTKVANFTSSVSLSSDALTKRCAQPGVC